jgi:hypothetical protein
MGHSQQTTMHPDENLLAAFAERTLVPAERGRVLEHLSDCADCREAVFLAQQAAGAADLQTALPFPEERKTSGAVRWRWRIASAAGLLSAVLIVALVSVHRHAGSPARLPPTQVADSGQPTSQTQNRVIPPTSALPIPAESNAPGLLSSKVVTARRPGFHSHSRRNASSSPAAPPNVASTSSALPLPAISPDSGTLPMDAAVAGSVIDVSGAVIPGAKVSIRLPDATTRQATTDSAGHFAIPSVPPGHYSIEFSSPGFQAKARQIDLHAQERAALSETLAIGSASTTVSVSAAPAAPQLQTENSAVSGTISGKQVAGLGLSGRNVPQLMTLTPGVSNQTGQDEARVGAHATTFSIRDGVVQSCAGSVCTARLLPSPSPVISVAFDARTAIVMDADGDLFSTSDAGEHWVAIKPQWQGKAIALRLASVLPQSVTQADAAPLANGPAGGQAGAAVGRAATGTQASRSVFELTNNRSQIWLSSDEGQTWRLKQ